MDEVNFMDEVKRVSNEALAEAVFGLATMLERYVDDEITRSERDIKGDYIQQMRENPKLNRKFRNRSRNIR